MDNDFFIPPDLSPAAREAVLRMRAAVEKHVARFNQKPFSWATIESQEQMQKEIVDITNSCPPGTFGTARNSGPPALERREYKGFVIAIWAVPLMNGQYSTLSGIRKIGDPITEDGFPLSDVEFPTHEAAVKAALDECRSKIDSEECG